MISVALFLLPGLGLALSECKEWWKVLKCVVLINLYRAATSSDQSVALSFQDPQEKETFQDGEGCSKRPIENMGDRLRGGKGIQQKGSMVAKVLVWEQREQAITKSRAADGKRERMHSPRYF